MAAKIGQDVAKFTFCNKIAQFYLGKGQSRTSLTYRFFSFDTTQRAVTTSHSICCKIEVVGTSFDAFFMTLL
jgi:hypothetical protein